MTNKIRTALVGCGKVGHTHAMALQTLANSQLVAVCDVETERAEDFGQRYEAQPFTSLELMIEQSGAQMITICTPHPTHADLV